MLLALLDGLFVWLGESAFIVPGNERLVLIIEGALDILEPLLLFGLFASLNPLFFFNVNLFKFRGFLLALLILNLWFFSIFHHLLLCLFLSGLSLGCIFSLYCPSCSQLILICLLLFLSSTFNHVLEGLVVLPMFFLLFLTDALSLLALLIDTSASPGLSKSSIILENGAVVQISELGDTGDDSFSVILDLFGASISLHIDNENVRHLSPHLSQNLLFFNVVI